MAVEEASRNQAIGQGNRKGNRLSHNASWMLAGRMVNFFLQAAYFVLLARLLGVRDYGVFAAAFALVNTFAPYSALGAAMLLLRYLSNDALTARTYWGNALATISAFTLIAAVTAMLWLGRMPSVRHWLMILALIVANCFLGQIIQLGSSLVFALGDARLSAVMSAASNLGRLVILVVMKIAMGHASASQWSVGLLVATFVPAALVYSNIHMRIGPSEFDWSLLKRRFWEGLGFSFAGTTEAVNNDLDKVMLAYYGMEVQNGFYTLAYRVIDFATSPIVALSAAVVQRHFTISSEGVRPVMRLALKSLVAAVALGLLIAPVTRLAAPLLPMVAGSGFVNAVAVVKILCWLPLIRGVHQMCGSAVTGMGFQNWRTAAQAIAALLNLVLNLAWIPGIGWRGAAWSTLVSDGALALLNLGLFMLLPRLVALRHTVSECSPLGVPNEY